jgi:hypothetical protein
MSYTLEYAGNKKSEKCLSNFSVILINGFRKLQKIIIIPRNFKNKIFSYLLCAAAHVKPLRGDEGERTMILSE